MKAYLSILAGALLLTSAAYADDHLVQATISGGLTSDLATDTISNRAGHVIPDTAPGQGSPFIGEHQCTPASDVAAGKEHVNLKPKGPDAGDCTEEGA